VEPDLPSTERVGEVNAGSKMLIRRQRVFLAVASTAALVAFGGLIASTVVKSPAELAAEQGPPAPSVLTAPVVRQVLTQTVVVRGTVVAGTSLPITPTGAQGATTLVVTRTVKHPGDEIAPGTVLIEVSGRPIVALAGAIPAYRDLKPGDTGNDVAQLQSALRALGYPDSDTDGAFGAGTKSAVTRLYEHVGYSVPTTGGPDDRGDTQALQDAARAVTTAQRAVTTGTQAVSDAEQALADAKATTPPSQTAIAKARQAVDQAQQALSYAREDVTTARLAQQHLIATTGPEMPLNEFVFLPSFPAHQAGTSATVGAAVAAPLLTIDTGALVVSSVLQRGDRSLVKVGLAVQLTIESLNQQADASVTNVGEYSAGTQAAPAQGGQSQPTGPQQAPGYPVTVTPTQALPSAWLGQDVRITIAAASTSGPVLVVPAAAVSTGADGATSVTVLRAGNERVRVPVTAGIDANGLIQVTPLGGIGLNVGDLVVTS
jgi:peptidoglycan hydrolase-like protein with peptidoglycan-binding domain